MIQLSVIGAGRWGQNLIKTFDQVEDCNIKFIVDSNVQAEIKHKLSSNYAFTDYAEYAIEHSDAVVIATPVEKHYNFVKLALQHNKNVFVEKPTFDALAHYERILDNTSKDFMTGYVFVYNDYIRYIRNLIHNGDLGKIYHLSFNRTNLGPIRTDVDCIFDLASHDIAILNYFFDIKDVECFMTSKAFLNHGISDVADITFWFDQKYANIHVSWLSPRKTRTLEVVGEEAMLTYDDLDPFEPLKIYDKKVEENELNSFGMYKTKTRDGNIFSPKIKYGEPLMNEAKHFINCVKNNQNYETGKHFSYKVQAILEKLKESQ